MTIKYKQLGVIERVNGVDMDQTRHFVKLHITTHLLKILIDRELIDSHTHTRTSDPYAPRLSIY